MVGGVWANVVRERAVGEGGETTRAREENDHHGRGRGARSSSMRHSVGVNTAIEGVVNGREARRRRRRRRGNTTTAVGVDSGAVEREISSRWWTVDEWKRWTRRAEWV